METRAKSFANQTEFNRGHIAMPVQHERNQPMSRQRGHEWAIDLTRLACTCNGHEHLARERLAPRQQLALDVGQVREGRAHGTTATPTNSIRAAGSNSSVTPMRAMAG